MTVKYTYDCPNCGNDYIEMRAASENQFFEMCSACKIGKYIEVSVEIISEEVERNAE
jgi:hypothetical protein